MPLSLSTVHMNVCGAVGSHWRHTLIHYDLTLITCWHLSQPDGRTQTGFSALKIFVRVALLHM